MFVGGLTLGWDGLWYRRSKEAQHVWERHP